jgi:hypothetical protein
VKIAFTQRKNIQVKMSDATEESKKRLIGDISENTDDLKKIDKNFKVGDIVCISTYPGRDHWQEVVEIIEVRSDCYMYRALQSRTIDRDWMRKVPSEKGSIPRGDWLEEQTRLFYGTTLEQEARDNYDRMMKAEKEKQERMAKAEKEKEDRIRQMIREEIANFIAELKEKASLNEQL